MSVVTRFAPSPTGRLHVGNIRTALHNALFALKQGGRFLLRIDDTDLERSREEYVEAIVADLAWLGLDAPSPFASRNASPFTSASSSGCARRAGSTPATKRRRSWSFAARCCSAAGCRRSMSASPKARRFPKAWRRTGGSELDHGAPIEWDDLIRGHQKFDPALISDPVIRRADGSWLYLLPSVIDDIDLAVTHIVRGEDHVSNSAVQLQMFAALGVEPPHFAHEALLVAAEGKLSKRLGSTGVDALREAGIEPLALLSLLARLGTSQPVEPRASLAALAEGFDFATFGRAPAHFDLAEVEQLNSKLLHHLDHADVADRLPEGIGEAEWIALRGNLAHLGEAADWLPVLHGDIDPPEVVPDDKPLLAEAAAAAADLDWSNDPWQALTGALKLSTGRKGRSLFHPLRLALTGREFGTGDGPAHCADRQATLHRTLAGRRS